MAITFDTSKIMNNLPLFEKVVDEYDTSKVPTACYGRELACLRLLEKTLIVASDENPGMLEELEKLITKVMIVRMILEVRAYDKSHGIGYS